MFAIGSDPLNVREKMRIERLVHRDFHQVRLHSGIQINRHQALRINGLPGKMRDFHLDSVGKGENYLFSGLRGLLKKRAHIYSQNLGYFQQRRDGWVDKIAFYLGDIARCDAYHPGQVGL